MERLFRLIEAPLIWLSSRLTNQKPSPVPEQSPGSIGESLLDCTAGQPITLPPSALQKHLYTLGATGSGKTNFLLKLIEQDIEKAQSFVVMDLRGDLVTRVLSLCRLHDVHPGRVALIDLREKDWVVGFDPLGGDGEPFVRALHLLDVIKSEADSWGVQLEETMRNAFLLLAQAGRSITELELLLFDTKFLDCLLFYNRDPSVAAFFDRYKQLSEEKQLAWALPVLNKITSLLATQGLRAILGCHEWIDIKHILDHKGSILLVSLVVDELHRSGRMLGALILSAISRTMLARVNIPEQQRNPVRLYVDEFENFGGEIFESLIAEGRRFKFGLVLSHQNLAQLPTKLRSVIRNNVGLQALFSCGYQDAKELAHELPDGLGLETLLQLQTGEMLLMPRGGEIQHVRCHLAQTSVEADDLADYRAEILRGIGQPLAKVLEQLQADKKQAPTLESLQRPWGWDGEL